MHYLVFLLIVIVCGSASAQGLDTLELARKGIVATRIGGESPVIDGKLGDTAWRAARFVSDFLQKEPHEGAQPSERTQVAFLYDDDALYVGARMFSVDPGNIRSIVTRRDNSGASERIIVTLDTYRDRRTAYSFSLTAAGVRTDYYHPTDFEFSRDYSFDAVWEGRATIDSMGWIAELRIPFSQLRFNDREEQVWGINMNRYIPSKDEDIYWVPIPKNGTGWASRFAELQGIRGIEPSLRLELMPYVAGGGRFTGERNLADPFDDGRNFDGRAGLDMKMGIGSNLTLDAAVNPDFGQVDADPAEVNLSAFETFFSERRPFFVEGSQLLEGDGPTYFYSRRIGASPHRDDFGADFHDIPSSSTILGAAKMTGRLESGLSIGSLAAITEREHARLFDAASGAFSDVEAEPLTGFGVLRLQQEFGASASTVGGIATVVHRGFTEGDILSRMLVRSAVTGGADWNIRFDDGEYVLSGHAGGSYLSGDSNAIAAIQRSSGHYFQRPDASHVSFDPGRTSLAGYTASLGFDRKSAEHWLWRVSTSVNSAGLELNEAGQMRRADIVSLFGRLQYRETSPGDLLHSYNVSAYVGADWNFEGIATSRNTGMDFFVTWKNFWSSNLGWYYYDRSYSVTATRGGPLMGTGRLWGGWISTSNSFGSAVRWTVGGGGGGNEVGSWDYNGYISAAANIGDRWEVSFDPSYSRSVETRQYVSTQDKGNLSTYGLRYIFSSIDRTTISAQIRVRYAVTPDLSLEVYAEPFAASGRYYDFGELPAPKSFDLRLYGTDGTSIAKQDEGGYEIRDGDHTLQIHDPDFNFGSFRSNMVLRWEWRPGSTLFLVWQQNRGTFDGRGESVRPRDIWDAVTAKGDNLLMVKVSYWLSVD